MVDVMIGEFLTFWNVSDLNKAFLCQNCYVDNVKMWTKHLDLGYISYVTEKDIGISLGVSTNRITKDLCD